MLLSALTLLLLCASVKAQNEAVLLQNIHVVDVRTGEVNLTSVLIQDGKISRIAGKISPKTEVKRIDGTGKYLIPGLVDAHIHLFQSGGIYTRPDALDLRAHKPYDEEIQWARANAGDILKRYLRCGITTVMDVGGPMSNYDIRTEFDDSQNYPNLYLTGPLISTYQPAALDVADPPIIKVATPEEARKKVQEQLPSKPDFIKIWYIASAETPAESTYDMVAATIDESHKHGLKVAVHATELNTAKLALKAGADFLVHSVEDEVADQEFIDLLKKKDVSYIPTLIVHENYIHTFLQSHAFTPEDFAISPPVPLGSHFDLKKIDNERLKRIQGSEKIVNLLRGNSHKADSVRDLNLSLLNDKSVNIVTGTDAGNIGTLHASSYYNEIATMREFGMSNLDILRASTINGAAILNQTDHIGVVEEGKIADLVVLDANPLEDLNALKNIRYVIKSGKVHAVDSILRPTPETLAQQQLNGYNARDIDAFLAPYSEDVEIYEFPNTLLYKGKEKMRARYGGMFESTPELHCELQNRTVHGNMVIDHERVTGFNRGGVIEAIAIYEMENGKIVRVYFPKTIRKGP